MMVKAFLSLTQIIFKTIFLDILRFSFTFSIFCPYINKDGTVRLSVLNKDGLGIVWNGGEMYEINEEEVG